MQSDKSFSHLHHESCPHPPGLRLSHHHLLQPPRHGGGGGVRAGSSGKHVGEIISRETQTSVFKVACLWEMCYFEAKSI